MDAREAVADPEERATFSSLPPAPSSGLAGRYYAVTADGRVVQGRHQVRLTEVMALMRWALTQLGLGNLFDGV